MCWYKQHWLLYSGASISTNRTSRINWESILVLCSLKVKRDSQVGQKGEDWGGECSALTAVGEPGGGLVLVSDWQQGAAGGGA